MFSLSTHKKKSSGNRIPIVAMMAYAMKDDAERCRDAGMDVYLAKPFQAEDLFDIIDRVLPGKSQAHTGALAERKETGGTLDWSAALKRVENDTQLLGEMALKQRI